MGNESKFKNYFTTLLLTHPVLRILQYTMNEFLAFLFGTSNNTPTYSKDSYRSTSLPILMCHCFTMWPSFSRSCIMIVIILRFDEISSSVVYVQGTSINDVPRFLDFFDLPNYLRPISSQVFGKRYLFSDVPFCLSYLPYDKKSSCMMANYSKFRILFHIHFCQ